MLVDDAFDVEKLRFFEIGSLAQVADDGQVLRVQRTGVLQQSHEEVQLQKANTIEDAHAVRHQLPVVRGHCERRFDSGRDLNHEQKHLRQRMPKHVPPAWNGLEKQPLFDVSRLVVQYFLVRLDYVIPAHACDRVGGS